MASPQHVEMEAAKLLQKLIHESKDEPAKLATKLFMICQHMKSSGKEHSLPYQVISRAMETVISQHGLDMNSLRLSRLPLASGTQIGDSASVGQKNKDAPDSSSPVAAVNMPGDGASAGSWNAASSSKSKEDNYGNSSLNLGASKDSKKAFLDNDVAKHEAIFSCAQPAGLCMSMGVGDVQPRSVSETNSKLFEQESQDSRSPNLREANDNTKVDKQVRQKDTKKVGAKRKKADSSPEVRADNPQQLDTLNTGFDSKEKKPTTRGDTQSHFPAKVAAAPEQQKLGIMKDAATRVSEKVPDTQWTPSFASADSSVYLPSGKMLERGASISRTGTGSMHMVQGGATLGPPSKNFVGKADINDISGQDSFAKPKSETLQTDIHGDSSIHKDMNPQRSMIPNDLGKTSQTSASSDRPFKEHQLKQLRAQCLVFLAFRNCLVPRKLHLEIALGSSYTKEGGDIDGTHEGLNDHRRDMPLKEPSNSQEVSGVPARPNDTWEAEKEMPLTRISPGSSSNASLIETDVSSKGKDATFGNFNYVRPVESLPATSESMISNGFTEACVGSGDQDNQRVCDFQKPGTSDGFRNFNFNDTVKYGNSVTALGKSMEQDEENISDSNDMPISSPKYTTTEKWIMEHCERKVLEEKKWALKLTKAEERIASCFDRLKENVSSSEDISAKTKSVIELKKLQLLQLQRRLQSDFLNDFFKPITSNMERLKSIKKHRHGRRLKQLERYEQKMKEERQKRIRERQKEFFSEVEAHKERLDEFFKVKRERCKGFHKYVKEFHKRKERLHREKIDRIQREKIFLLKTNDVEGYLRMVQDTKSDRVKQLLKETEKYLQKLGSKLQEAKVMASRFEMEMDDNRAINVEKNEISVDNEDESDQAQHYLESNEKYYLLAHSVKESINEQPTSLQGGKLREYQMNGLRWLVSLHNNHLNGILADEMGLGKTVQVISLICYLMEAKNSRGPFLVVVPSSVLPGWETEFNFWAPSINCITYAGPPEVRRRLFKERIAPHKFNVLLTTYEYLMNKNDRPRLSKLHWHYLIIDEGHRIKNASCKLNADLKHFQSSYRLLLTGTPLQNNLEELWALLNFLLPNIFNSSEDFSQWFNKPFESGVDNSPDEALLSEEENLLIINRLHQVLRPFVLRRLKHKVANELPEKIERLIRCEASAYQKLLMKRVEDNLGSLGSSKGRSVHNSVMELRNICNHPYLSQLHAEEVSSLIPKHYLPPIVRLCGKLEMLDRLLPKLKATDHRVLLFSTMTRLLDIMEEYLCWKRYKYLRLDGHTSGNERGALIEEFNRPDSQAFIFLLSLRAGGVGVNLQAADTVIIFDTDWNPQVDLQAQARAHRIGQKKDVLVLRLETVRTVEEQVRAAAEHKLGVANQSITAGFFDNNTSAEDRREYLESLLREGKKEETTAVLEDDVLNDVIARSGSEIDIFESIDRQRHEKEMAAWQSIHGECNDGSEPLPPMPPRLVTDDDLKVFYQAMQIYEASNLAMKRKSEYLGGLDTQHYGRGKRAREVRSYEDQWTEEEFEKLCQVDPPDSPETKVMPKDSGMTTEAGGPKVGNMDAPFLPSEELPPLPSKESQPSSKESPLLCKELQPLQSYEPLPLQLKELPLPSKELQPPLSEEPLRQCKLVKQQPCEPPQPSKEQVLPAKESQPSGTVPRPPPPVKRGRGRPRRVPVNVSPSPRVASVPSETPGIAPVPSETPRVAPVPSESPRVAPTPSETPRASPMPSETPRVAPVRSETPRVAPAPSETPKISPMPSETVSKQEMERQKDVFGSSVTIPVSSHHVKAQTINFQHGAGTVPSSLTSPSPVLPSQVMGQSQKAQSGSGRPRKRAKKLNADSTAAGPELNPVPLVPTQIDMATVTSNATSQTFAFAQQMERLIRPSGPSNATSPLNFELNQIPGIPNVVFLVPVLAPNASLGPVSGTQAAAFQTQSLPIASIESKQHDSGNLCVHQPGQQLKVSHSPTVSSSLAQDLKERRTLRVGSSDMASDEGQKSSEKPQTSYVQSTGKDGTSFDAPKVEPPNSSSKPSEADTHQVHVAPNTAPVMNSQDEKNDEMVEVPLVEVPVVEVPLPQKRSAEGSRTPAPAKRGSKKRGPVATRQTRQTRSRSAAISEGSVGSSHAHKVELKTDNMKSNENKIVFEAAGSAHAHVIELKTDNNSNKSMPVSVAAVGSGHVHVVELKIENNKSDGSTNVSEAGPGSGAHVDSKTDENEISAKVTPTDEQGNGEKQTENATSEQASNLVVKQSVTMSSQKLSSALEVACSVPCQSETGIMGLSISECSLGSKDGSDHITNEKSRTLIDGTAVQHLPEQHSETANQVSLTAVSPITGLTSEKQESQSPEQNTAGEPHKVNESRAPGDRNATLEAISVEPKKTDHVLSETGYPGEKAVSSEVVETAVNNSCAVSVALTDTPSASTVVKPEMTITDSGSKQADAQNAEINDICSTDANKKADGVAGLSRSDVLDIPNVAVVTTPVKSMQPVKHADNPIHTIGEEAIGSGASVHPDKADESVGASCIEKKNVPGISPEEGGPSHAPNLPVVSSTTALPCEETKSDVPAQGAGNAPEEAGPSDALDLPSVASNTSLPFEETRSDQHALEVLTSSQNNQDDVLSEATCIRSEDKKTLLSEEVPSFATESHNSDPATCTEGQIVLDVISDKAGPSEGADLPCISSNTASPCEETKLHKYSFEGADPVDIRKEALEVSTSSQNVQDDGSLSKATCLGSGDENMLVSESGPSVEKLVSEAGPSVATAFHISHPLSEDGSELQAAAFDDSNCEPQAAAVADNNCEPQAAAFDDSNCEPQAAAVADNNCEPQAAAVDSNCEPQDAVDGNCSEPQAAAVDSNCEPRDAVDGNCSEPQAAAVDDNNYELQAATIDDCNYEPQAAAVDNNCEPQDAALVDDCSEPQTAAVDNDCEPEAAAVDNNREPRAAAVVDDCSEPQAAAVDDSNFELQTAAVDNNCEPQAAAVENNFEPQDAAVDDDCSEPQAAAVDDNCEPQDATVDNCELQDAAVGDSKETCTGTCIEADPFEIQDVCTVGEDCSNASVTNISETDNAAPTRMSHFGVKETDLPEGNSEPFSSPSKEEDEKVNATSAKDSALSLESNDTVKIPQACIIEKEDEEDEKMNATSNEDSAVSVESNDTVNITQACSEEKPDKDEKVSAVSNKDSAASIESIDAVNISHACTEEEGGEDEKANADSDKDSAVCIESIDTVNVPQASTEEKEDEEHEKVNAVPNKESAVSIESNDTTNIPQVCSEEKDGSTGNPDKALFSLGEETNIVEISKDSVVSTSESLHVVEEKKVAETVTVDSTSPSKNS